MRKKILLAFLILVFVILALVINIRLEIVKLPEVSLGAFLLGDIGHADGLKVLMRLAIDLTLYSIVSYALASIGLWLYERIAR